ncbi:hypothetical protein HG530_012141 [Fusarium avenaceum]|nr:hypothetical protein HG530_012141 [Fusarium avenaceum]
MRTVTSLDLGSLTTTRVAQTTKDLTGLSGTELKGEGRLGLEASNRASKAQHGLSFSHTLALEDKVLEPVIRSLDLAGHVGKLHADDRVINKLLTKGASLAAVLDGLLVANTGESKGLDDDTHALMVEVGHDDWRHFSTGTLTSSNVISYSNGKVVRPDTVGDPLLLTVDDVVFAILAQLSLAGQVGNITTGIGLSDGQADTLLAAQNTGHDAVLELLLTKLDKRWAANSETTDDVPHETTGSSAGQLVGDDHLVEKIPLISRDRLNTSLRRVLSWELDTEETSKVTTTTHLFVDLLRNLLGLVPVGNMRLDVVLDPFADLSAEGSMRFIEGSFMLSVHFGTKQGQQMGSGRRRALEPRHLPP